LSQKWGSSGAGRQLIMSHGSAFVSPSSLSGRDPSARDLAISPLHPELRKCRGTTRRAWARCLLRNGAALGAEIRPADRAQAAARPPAPERALASRRARRPDRREADVPVARRRARGRGSRHACSASAQYAGGTPTDGASCFRNRVSHRSCSSPTRWAPTARLSGNCASPALTIGASERTIAPKTPIRSCGDESARCSSSSHLDLRSVFSTSIPPPTTPSTIKRHVISRSTLGSSEPKPPPGGKMLLPSREHGSASPLSAPRPLPSQSPPQGAAKVREHGGHPRINLVRHYQLAPFSFCKIPSARKSLWHTLLAMLSSTTLPRTCFLKCDIHHAQKHCEHQRQDEVKAASG
jgi:hypothetical protein